MCVLNRQRSKQQWPAQQDLDYAAKPLRWIMFTEGVVPLVCFKEKKQTFYFWRSIAGRIRHVQGWGCVLEAFFTNFLKTAELVRKHLCFLHPGLATSPTRPCAQEARGEIKHMKARPTEDAWSCQTVLDWAESLHNPLASTHLLPNTSKLPLFYFNVVLLSQREWVCCWLALSSFWSVSWLFWDLHRERKKVRDGRKGATR